MIKLPIEKLYYFLYNFFPQSSLVDYSNSLLMVKSLSLLLCITPHKKHCISHTSLYCIDVLNLLPLGCSYVSPIRGVDIVTRGKGLEILIRLEDYTIAFVSMIHMFDWVSERNYLSKYFSSYESYMDYTLYMANLINSIVLILGLQYLMNLPVVMTGGQETEIPLTHTIKYEYLSKVYQEALNDLDKLVESYIIN